MTRLARLALSLLAMLALLVARPSTSIASTRAALDACTDLVPLAAHHAAASTPVSPGCAERSPSSASASTAKGETDGAQRALAREHRRVGASNTQKNPHYSGNAMPDQLPEDGFVYFYHPDHLGSTSYVTDAAGDVYEHTGYFPHGETWIDQANSSEALPYLFTGKELDQETGLYYFGARYYDPQTALWQSADPALNDFLADGRIGHPPRLSLYAYTWHNPLRLRDPDGRDPGCGDACFQSVALMDGAITLEQATRSELMVGLGVVVSAATVVALEVAAASPVAAMEAANMAVEAAGGTGISVARTVGVGVALKAADKVADSGMVDDAARAARGLADDVASQVAGMFGGGGKAARGARTAEDAGIASGHARRIQNAATRTRQRITVVGSRAEGTAKPGSDWDYIMSGNSSQRHSARTSVPKGGGGGEMGPSGPTGRDVWQDYNPGAPGYNPVDPSLPHVVFEP